MQDFVHQHGEFFYPPTTIHNEVATTKTLVELFQESEYDDSWDECSDIQDVLIYCRGSKKLKIPPEWRPVLPSEL